VISSYSFIIVYVYTGWAKIYPCTCPSISTCKLQLIFQCVLPFHVLTIYISLPASKHLSFMNALQNTVN